MVLYSVALIHPPHGFALVLVLVHLLYFTVRMRHSKSESRPPGRQAALKQHTTSLSLLSKVPPPVKLHNTSPI